jgi:hypothetical protein
MRPILEGVVAHYKAMMGDRPLHLIDFARMNDALDVRAENDRRARER